MTAPYRANALERDLNLPQGTPNLQRRQTGFAHDYGHLDIYGRPDTVYSWNRNIHRKDLATRKPRGSYAEVTRLPRQPSISKGRLDIIRAPTYSKAYKDGLEYIKAEEDYRERQRYLDKITPTRSNGLLTVGTNLSTSGLPIPNADGYVFHYPAEVTSQTGLMFEAPSHNEPPIINYTNDLVRPRNPVILTKETHLTVDAETGAPRLSEATGSASAPPIVVPERQPIPMPKIFTGTVTVPNDSPKEELEPPNPILPGSFPLVRSEPVQPPVTITDNTEVKSVIQEQEKAALDIVLANAPQPATSPFIFMGKARIEQTPSVLGKRKKQKQEEDTPAKKRRIAPPSKGKRKADDQLERPIIKTRRIEENVEDVKLTPYVEPTCLPSSSTDIN
ncbi:hypothetical protein DFS34DRAFT_684064 [Phlyctochytrium arcticum]|nr:hypothetical protein DFS34DRAFT_684064 [Phlyctochytrium arcticum]